MNAALLKEALDAEYAVVKAKAVLLLSCTNLAGYPSGSNGWHIWHRKVEDQRFLLHHAEERLRLANEATAKWEAEEKAVANATLERPGTPCPHCHGGEFWECGPCGGTGWETQPVLRKSDGSVVQWHRYGGR